MDSDGGMSTSSSLSRTLNDAVVLPNISPLSDKRKLRPTLGVEHIADNLERNGFQVGWDDGNIQVSPSASARATPSYDMSPMHGSGGRSGFRPRTSGFLTFTRSKSEVRPRTSNSVSMGSSSSPGSPLRKPASCGSGNNARFSRLAASMDSNILRVHDHEQPEMPAAAPRGPHPPHGFGSGGAAASSGPAHVAQALLNRDKMHIPLANLRDLERPGTGMLASSSGRGMGLGAGYDIIDASPKSTQHAPHPSSHFAATRGHALMVFNELDKDKNGKITKSEFEEAALNLGLSMEQTNSLFAKLDKRGRGYLEARDWGSKDLFKQIQLLCTRYMQKHMGLPDVSTTPEQARKYWRMQELVQVRSLPAAINKVRVNAVAKGTNSGGGSGNSVFDTFRFMDVDGSGDLSKDELRDAFYALGVYLSDEVADQIMQTFDSDGSGSVQYHEFLKSFFPAVHRAQGTL